VGKLYDSHKFVDERATVQCWSWFLSRPIHPTMFLKCGDCSSRI
jgi:hypothetical protein